MTGTAWERALALFTDGYGSPPDFDDDEDRAEFLQLLTKEVRDAMDREIADFFRDATERLQANRSPEAGA